VSRTGLRHTGVRYCIDADDGIVTVGGVKSTQSTSNNAGTVLSPLDPGLVEPGGLPSLGPFVAQRVRAAGMLGTVVLRSGSAVRLRY
jgi:hypothetical protein